MHQMLSVFFAVHLCICFKIPGWKKKKKSAEAKFWIENVSVKPRVNVTVYNLPSIYLYSSSYLPALVMIISVPTS